MSHSGLTATIKNLESSDGMALNEKTGEIDNYEPSKNRWTVTVDGIARSIKAENLELNDERNICFLSFGTRSEMWTRAKQKGWLIAGAFGVCCQCFLFFFFLQQHNRFL